MIEVIDSNKECKFYFNEIAYLRSTYKDDHFRYLEHSTIRY